MVFGYYFETKKRSYRNKKNMFFLKKKYKNSFQNYFEKYSFYIFISIF